MTDKETLQYVDECLENYPSNLIRIEVLNKDLQLLRSSSDVHAQNYLRIHNNDSVNRGSHSDPVVSYVLQIEKVEEEIKRLQRITEPISKMIQDLKTPYATDDSLNNDFIKILGLYYFGRNSVQIVLEITRWSRAAFFRKKKQLALLAKNYLGY